MNRTINRIITCGLSFFAASTFTSLAQTSTPSPQKNATLPTPLEKPASTQLRTDEAANVKATLINDTPASKCGGDVQAFTPPMKFKAEFSSTPRNMPLPTQQR
jgi:hypothetical protein